MNCRVEVAGSGTSTEDTSGSEALRSRVLVGERDKEWRNSRFNYLDLSSGRALASYVGDGAADRGDGGGKTSLLLWLG